MAIPLHTLNLYQKPTQGDAFIRRLPVYSYRHEINAIGGFDTAQFDVALRSVDESKQFLDQYLGNRVAMYADNPAEPIWEGFINRMTFSAGGVQYSISLDEMANLVTVKYAVANVLVPSGSAQSANADSQALYGIKQANVDVGPQFAIGTGLSGLRTTALAQRAWPLSSITRGSGSGLLHIECLGFYHTLEWTEFVDTSTAGGTLRNSIIVQTLPNDPNGATFYDNADFTEVDANTLIINFNHIRGGTFWQRLQQIADCGNGTNYFVIGITPLNPATGTRRFYYRAQNTAVEYTAKQSDGLRIRNPFGQIVDPWRVRPDRGIRVSDQLIGWNGIGNDPAETWIRAITYDANQQTVDYQGDDDTTAEGAFQLKRYDKASGSRFAPRRMV